MAAAGGGLVVVVARDGSPMWQVIRGAGAVLWIATVAWASSNSHQHVGRALVAFGSGSCAMAAGLGLAVPHLTKVGLSVVSVAGVALVLGGLALAWQGAQVLTRMAGRLTRLVLVPLLGMTALLAIWCVGVAVAATNVPRTEVGDRTPAAANLTFDEVTFETDDGVTLSAWYIPSRNGAAVVLVHGAGSTRSGVLEHAVVLAENGYGALLFDSRGHGRSDGRAMDMGWYGDSDIAAAVTFLEHQPDVVDGQIAAVGLSMGAEEAIGAAAVDQRITAVVAEGATGRTAADKAWLSEVHGWRGQVQEGVDRLLYGTMDLLTSSHPPITLREAVADAAPRPILLIAAGNVPDEADAGRYIREGAPGSVELWVVAGTTHTAALDTHARQWEARVLRFLADAFGPKD